MGNNPNKFIQCGVPDKDVKQEVLTTKEEAIRANKGDLTKPTLNKKPSFSQTKPIPQHQNLTRVSKHPRPGMCKVQNSTLYEDCNGKCLDEIIQSRYNTTMHFPEEQVVDLLQSLVYSLAYLTKKSIPHHDFYPTNIFYEDRVFRLRNPLAVPCSAYSTTQQRKRFSFLSPELIKQILVDKSESQLPTSMLERADVFGVGMILLQFCTLEPSSECYDEETYKLIPEKIGARLQKCNEIYHPLVVQVLDMMLQQNPTNRIPPIELAYQVHSKLQQIKRQNVNESSSRSIPPPGYTSQPPPGYTSQPPPYISMPPGMAHPFPPNHRISGPPPSHLYSNMQPSGSEVYQISQRQPMPMPVGQQHMPMGVGNGHKYQGNGQQQGAHKMMNPFQLIKQDEEEEEESPDKVNGPVGERRPGEESLDDKVRRILNASRNIQ